MSARKSIITYKCEATAWSYALDYYFIPLLTSVWHHVIWLWLRRKQ